MGVNQCQVKATVEGVLTQVVERGSSHETK